MREKVQIGVFKSRVSEGVGWFQVQNIVDVLGFFFLGIRENFWKDDVCEVEFTEQNFWGLGSGMSRCDIGERFVLKVGSEVFSQWEQVVFFVLFFRGFSLFSYIGFFISSDIEFYRYLRFIFGMFEDQRLQLLLIF